MEIVDILIFFAMCIISYLIGGISVARFITSKEKDGGIKQQGSGNPGTMNMLRTHGIFMGLFTLLCDALKGVLPALFGLLYFGQYDIETAYMALFVFGFFAVIGHIYPVYYKFKGGKGIATTFGVFMVADPISTIILFGILFLVLYFIKIGSVVSLLMITINAIIQLFKDYMENNWVAIVFMWVMVVLDIYAHRINIKRLLINKENPADLQEGFQKDIEKIKNKRQKKLDRVAEKQGRIEDKYDRKINRKIEKVQKQLDKFSDNQENIKENAKNSLKTENQELQINDTQNNTESIKKTDE